MRILLLLLAAPLAARAESACPPQKLQAARFTQGETLQYKLDALGAELGTFELRVEAPPASDRKRAALLLRSRVKTSNFVSTNVKRYDALATVLLAPDLSPLHYREDIDEGDVHKGQEVDFPPAGGVLKPQVSVNGKAETLALPASADVREILSTLYLLRAQPMELGAPVCVEVIAGRKVWLVHGQAAARETIETPLGKFATLRFDASAVRTDDARQKREAHVWVSDDDRRLPLVAIGDIRGKTIRAQLVEASGLKRLAKRK